MEQSKSQKIFYVAVHPIEFQSAIPQHIKKFCELIDQFPENFLQDMKRIEQTMINFFHIFNLPYLVAKGVLAIVFLWYCPAY